eukprot:gene572-3888_t
MYSAAAAAGAGAGVVVVVAAGGVAAAGGVDWKTINQMSYWMKYCALDAGVAIHSN